MNTQRLFDAMALKFSLEQKNLEDALERNVNSDVELTYKVAEFERILGRMVTLDASINKFKEIISSTQNNNDTTKLND